MHTNSTLINESLVATLLFVRLDNSFQCVWFAWAMGTLFSAGIVESRALDDCLF
jgi:hypothetical protein